MEFEEWKLLSSIIHYSICLILLAPFIWKYFNDLPKFIITTYIILVLWAITCAVFNGCPLTHIENYLSLKYLGAEFYPGYNFTGSIVYEAITERLAYYPLILFILYKIVEHGPDRITDISSWKAKGTKRNS